MSSETLGERAARLTSDRSALVPSVGFDEWAAVMVRVGLLREAVSTLRALAAENDALRADADAHDTPAWIANERLNMQRDDLIAERDAAATALNEALAAVTSAEQRAANAEAALEAMARERDGYRGAALDIRMRATEDKP